MGLHKYHWIMLRNWILILGLLFFGKVFGQTATQYYIEWEPEINKEQESETRLSSFLKTIGNRQIQQRQPVYPEASSPRLRQIYSAKIKSDKIIEELKGLNEIRNISPTDRPRYGDAFPNDYYDSIGQPETALQLIRAPQAWQITHGDSTKVFTGIVDRYVDENHEDLIGKLGKIIRMGTPSSNDHGTGVAVTLAGNTNNGKGFASIGYDTKLAIVTGNYPLINGLDSLINVPGIKIINTSWVYCQTSGQKKKLDSIVRKAQKKGILIVAAAGNGKKHPCRLNSEDKINGYHYPASYNLDNVISVTSVGNKYPYGHYDPVRYKKSGWTDCHQNNPFTDDPSLLNQHTHNDSVDISAPGIKVPVAYKDNVYKYDKWGTSEAAPYVAGTAALMLAVNPDLTAAELKQILLETSDNIDHLPCNEAFIGKIGAGRLNAYRAVLTADCMANPRSGYNLIIRDGIDDFGEEPYNGNNYSLDSPDIRIRLQNDGLIYQVRENPVYKKGKKNYVYLHITNTGCEVSPATEKVKLYWGKTQASIPWKVGQEAPYEKGIALGGMVGETNIPSLGPGEETIVEIPWEMPNPKSFKKTSSKDNSFYLMAAIGAEEASEDPQWKTTADAVFNSSKRAWRLVYSW